MLEVNLSETHHTPRAVNTATRDMKIDINMTAHFVNVGGVERSPFGHEDMNWSLIKTQQEKSFEMWRCTWPRKKRIGTNIEIARNKRCISSTWSII